MLEICIQTSYDQNVQLILKSYLPVVLGTTLSVYNYYNMVSLVERTTSKYYMNWLIIIDTILTGQCLYIHSPRTLWMAGLLG